MACGFLLAALLTACGSSGSDGGSGNDQQYQSRNTNADPTQGWVLLGNDSKERCAGPDLIVESTYDGSIAISPDDSQCSGTTPSPEYTP